MNPHDEGMTIAKLAGEAEVRFRQPDGEEGVHAPEDRQKAIHEGGRQHAVVDVLPYDPPESYLGDYPVVDPPARSANSPLTKDLPPVERLT